MKYLEGKKFFVLFEMATMKMPALSAGILIIS